jgi:hypothetical protein
MSGIDRVVYGNFVNYFYPQYVLPWNNFYGRIEAQPFYTKTVQVNQNALIAQSAKQYNANPNLQTQNSTLPDFVDAITEPSIGNVLLQDSKKYFTGKYLSLVDNVITQTGLQYNYELSGTIVDTSCLCGQGDKWIVLLFDLAPSQNNRKLTIASVGSNPTLALQGNIIFGANNVSISNPTTIENYDPNTGNTIWSIVGNRLLLAIQVDGDFDSSINSVVYDIETSIVELFTLAENLNFGSGNFNA